MNSGHQIIGKACLASFAALLLSYGFCASNAVAEEQLRTETVKFADLNVGTSEGVQALYTRIHAAAGRVCFQTDPVMKAAALSCAKTAEAKAVEKLNLPSLTAYYRTKTGKYAAPLSAKR